MSRGRCWGWPSFWEMHRCSSPPHSCLPPKLSGEPEPSLLPSSNPHQCVTLEKPVVFSNQLPPFCHLPSLGSPPGILSSTVLSFNFPVPASRASSWIFLQESPGKQELSQSQRNLTSLLGVPWSWVLRTRALLMVFSPPNLL